MKFGYYLTLPGQIEETQDHVNLLWLDDRRLSAEDLANATMLGKTCVIDVSGCIFNGRAIRPDATERLQALRAYIKLHGRLSAVRSITPCDEPNLPDERNVMQHIPQAVSIMRAVWPEARLLCNYYNDGVFEHMELFDDVGFDDYNGGFGICLKPRWWERIKLFFGGFVRRGSYLRFAERLRPDQRSFLMPGGSYGERPERWVAFAKTRPEVWAIVPFLAASNVDGSEISGILSQPEIRAAYVAAGLSLVGEQS